MKFNFNEDEVRNLYKVYIRDVYSNNISSATYDVSILAHVSRKPRKPLVNLHLDTEEFKCTKLFVAREALFI